MRRICVPKSESRSCSRSLAFLGFLLTLLVALPALACSVPVFRYALERWPSDPYEAVVFHRGPLTPEQQALVDSLSPDGRAGEIAANVQVLAVDLDQNPDPELVQLWESRGTETLPYVVLRYPRPLEPAWSGPLDAETVDHLLDSPQRREIARRLVKGETAVWVLLESSDAAKNDAAAALLEQELAKAEATLELPEIDQKDIADGLMTAAPGELKIDFSLLRLSRNDPQEKLFVEMLLGGEADLREFDEPLAFPVFGRGRVLYALVGPGINADTISEACRTLVGPCTCQVKEDNPGTDLLMAVNWDALVTPTPTPDKPLPPLSGLAGFQADPDASSQDEPLADASPSPEDTTSPGSTESAPKTAEPKTTPVSTVAVVTAPSLPPSTESETDGGAAAQAPPEDIVATPVEVSEADPLVKNILIVAGLGILAVVVVSFVIYARSRGSSV